MRCEKQLVNLLEQVLPDDIAPSHNFRLKSVNTKQAFIQDARAGLKAAPMAMSLTPHILSRVDWKNPLDDPIRLQFIPLKSGFVADRPELKLDSLNEEADSR